MSKFYIILALMWLILTGAEIWWIYIDLVNKDTLMTLFNFLFYLYTLSMTFSSLKKLIIEKIKLMEEEDA